MHLALLAGLRVLVLATPNPRPRRSSLPRLPSVVDGAEAARSRAPQGPCSGSASGGADPHALARNEASRQPPCDVKEKRAPRVSSRRPPTRAFGLFSCRRCACRRTITLRSPRPAVPRCAVGLPSRACSASTTPCTSRNITPVREREEKNASIRACAAPSLDRGVWVARAPALFIP